MPGKRNVHPSRIINGQLLESDKLLLNGDYIDALSIANGIVNNNEFDKIKDISGMQNDISNLELGLSPEATDPKELSDEVQDSTISSVVTNDGTKLITVTKSTGYIIIFSESGFTVSKSGNLLTLNTISGIYTNPTGLANRGMITYVDTSVVNEKGLGEYNFGDGLIGYRNKFNIFEKSNQFQGSSIFDGPVINTINLLDSSGVDHTMNGNSYDSGSLTLSANGNVLLEKLSVGGIYRLDLTLSGGAIPKFYATLFNGEDTPLSIGTSWIDSTKPTFVDGLYTIIIEATSTGVNMNASGPYTDVDEGSPYT